MVVLFWDCNISAIICWNYFCARFILIFYSIHMWKYGHPKKCSNWTAENETKILNFFLHNRLKHFWRPKLIILYILEQLLISIFFIRNGFWTILKKIKFFRFQLFRFRVLRTTENIKSHFLRRSNMLHDFIWILRLLSQNIHNI